MYLNNFLVIPCGLTCCLCVFNQKACTVVIGLFESSNLVFELLCHNVNGLLHLCQLVLQ